jgi:hypothetical protein
VLEAIDAQLQSAIERRPRPSPLVIADRLRRVWELSFAEDGTVAGRSAAEPATAGIAENVAFHDSRILLRSCPQSATEAECLTILDARDARAGKQRHRVSTFDFLDGLRDLRALNTRGVPLAIPLDFSAGNQSFVAQSAEMAFSLAALRVLARYRLEAQREGACPDTDIFESYELDEAMIDPTSGNRLRVDEIAPGKFVIGPSHGLFGGYGDATKPAIFIDCPFDGFGASAGPRP